MKQTQSKISQILFCPGVKSDNILYQHEINWSPPAGSAVDKHFTPVFDYEPHHESQWESGGITPRTL